MTAIRLPVALVLGAGAGIALPRLVLAADRRRAADLDPHLVTALDGLTEHRIASADGTALAVVEKGQGRHRPMRSSI